MPRSLTPSRMRSLRVRRVLLDPRLVVGVVLVGASVAGVVGIVTASDRTRDLYVARAAVAPGQVLTTDDLEVRAVALGTVASRYLAVGELPDEGVVVIRPVAAGELISTSAVGTTGAAEYTAVIVRTEGALPEAVHPGARVDVWAALPDQTTPPAVIVAEATVARLVTGGAFVSSGEITGVELLVPRSRVARVITAQSAEAMLVVVPSGLPFEPR